jgi:hypothetical protein
MYVLPLGLRSTKSLFVLLSDVYTFYLVEPKWSKVSAIAHTAYGHSRPSLECPGGGNALRYRCVM